MQGVGSPYEVNGTIANADGNFDRRLKFLLDCCYSSTYRKIQCTTRTLFHHTTLPPFSNQWMDPTVPDSHSNRFCACRP